MSIKKFILSSGDGDLEESELDLSGSRTIGYDDVQKIVVLSSAKILGNLYVSGSVSGTLLNPPLSGASDLNNVIVGSGNTSVALSGSKLVISSSAGISSVYSEGNITGSGESSNKIRLIDNLTNINSITSSYMLIQNNIRVNGTASVALLETISQSSLKVGDKYIVIMSGGIDHFGLDGAGMLWGSGSTGPTVDENGANAYIKYRSTYDKLEIYPGLRVAGGVTSSVGFSGDGYNLTNIYPKVRFTSKSGSVSVGDLVSLGNNGLAACNNTSDLLSNVIGVVISSGSDGIYVQTSGEAAVSTVYGSYTTGTVLYAGAAGSAVIYSNINSGEYITQVGYISGNGDAKIIIQPRVFGQKA